MHQHYILLYIVTFNIMYLLHLPHYNQPYSELKDWHASCSKLCTQLNTFFNKHAWASKRNFIFFLLFTSSVPSELILTTPTTTTLSINRSFQYAYCVLSPPTPETATPAQGFPCHLLTLLNYLATTPFIWAGIINANSVFSNQFFSSCLSLGINLYLVLCSVKSASYYNDSLTKSTALWQSWLFPSLSVCAALLFN